jgi:hypothetical protein
VQAVTDVIGFFKSDAVVAAKPATHAVAGQGRQGGAGQAHSQGEQHLPSVSPTQSSGGKKVAATGTDDGWEEF